MNVLVVDDSRMARLAVRNLLQAAGHQVTDAGDGREAMEVLRAGQCRLVLSDWEMPEMDGLELCRRIRHEDLPGYVYFILLTAHGSLQERVAGLQAGADDFIPKPYSPEEVLARVLAGERILSLETRDVALFAMAKLAESRDPETGSHLERIQNYCRVLGQQLAGMKEYHDVVDPEFLRMIHLTSPMHDIGKVGIPDSVLLKPGRLNDREFAIMKSHALIGARTLDAALRKYPNAPFLRMARDTALTHHERFDGSGYPNALKGEDIPLCGRIVALADVYDALCSKRVYKKAFTHDVTRGMIAVEAGKHFDPDVVDAFLQSEEQFVAIKQRFHDLAEEETEEDPLPTSLAGRT